MHWRAVRRRSSAFQPVWVMFSGLRSRSVTTRMATDLGADDLTATIEAPAVVRSPADRFMRRLLRLPVDGPAGTAEGARQAFQTSILVATVRCLLMYIVFPFVLPA